MSVTIRNAVKDDMKNILDMIQELADFEKMPEGPMLKLEDLIRDGGFESNSNTPLFFCFVAEEVANDSQDTDKSPNTERSLTRPLTIGYALCFYSYSSWEGKSLFLEDIYVKTSHRMRGVGRQIFAEVVRHAQKTNCSRLDFHVLDWNPARKFYDKMNSVNLTAKEGWQLYRLNRENFEKMLN